MRYVIQLADREHAKSGQYVAKSGSKSSYTRKLEHAATYETLDAAQRNACGNERAVSLDALFSR